MKFLKLEAPIQCRSCTSVDCQKLFDVATTGISFYRCEKCGCVFNDVTPYDYERYFKAYVEVHTSFKKRIGYQFLAYSWIAKSYFHYLESKLDFKNICSILEIGCSYGHLLELLNKKSNRGLSVLGVESDQYMNKHSRLATHQRMCKFFDQHTKLERIFDLVILPQMLCYQQQPELLIKNALEHLKSGGFLFIATTNPGCIEGLRLMSNNKYMVTCPVLWSKSNFEFFCAQYKCKLLDCSTCEPKLFWKETTIFSKLYRFELRGEDYYRYKNNGYHLFMLLQKE